MPRAMDAAAKTQKHAFIQKSFKKDGNRYYGLTIEYKKNLSFVEALSMFTH
jgi:hypothetical protein